MEMHKKNQNGMNIHQGSRFSSHDQYLVFWRAIALYPPHIWLGISIRRMDQENILRKLLA